MINLKLHKFVDETIDIRLVCNCTSVENWVKTMVEICEQEPDLDFDGDIREEIEGYIQNKTREGEMIWSDSLGSVVLL